MKTRLTERQNEAYEYIGSYMREHRKPPTLQEIGQALGIVSTNGVFKLLKALEQKGYIKREKHAARGMTLVDGDDAFGLDDDLPSLLLISRTSSDRPEELRKRPSSYLTIDPYFLRRVEEPEATCLVARAGDDGMNGDGIRKGDYLIVEEVPWRKLKNREIVAVLIGEMLQVRRFTYANGRFHLRPADRTYSEDTFAPDDPNCYVVGRVIGMMRRL